MKKQNEVKNTVTEAKVEEPKKKRTIRERLFFLYASKDDNSGFLTNNNGMPEINGDGSLISYKSMKNARFAAEFLGNLLQTKVTIFAEMN